MSRQAVRRASYRTATDYVLDADRIILDKPKLRSFFYENEPLPAEDTEEWPEVMAAAEFYLDVLEAIWDHRSEFALVDRASWREWIHDLFEWSPALKFLYGSEEGPDWYPSIHSLLQWERCSKSQKHKWAEKQPGPQGSGIGFQSRRLLRRTPGVGHFVKR